MIFDSLSLLLYYQLIVVTDQLRLLIAEWVGTKTGHTKLCIGLQGFACFSKMGRVSAVVMG
ncbi:hypothetical protein CE874_01275 [Salmonella enterica subsp. enterica serovar Napoli]|nr:hypothetical protein [Salmonella enterica]ECS7283067.1 hypothetical protein [Salmonella enterica subsp. enterica serovar Napoli]